MACYIVQRLMGDFIFCCSLPWIHVYVPTYSLYYHVITSANEEDDSRIEAFNEEPTNENEEQSYAQEEGETSKTQNGQYELARNEDTEMTESVQLETHESTAQEVKVEEPKEPEIDVRYKMYEANGKQIMNLIGCNLTIFPKQILEIPTLQGLFLTTNSIENVPEEICSMQNLEVLVVQGNALSELPSSIGKHNVYIVHVHCLRRHCLIRNYVRNCLRFIIVCW